MHVARLLYITNYHSVTSHRMNLRASWLHVHSHSYSTLTVARRLRATDDHTLHFHCVLRSECFASHPNLTWIYLTTRKWTRLYIRCFVLVTHCFRLASDLEAFSHYPADDSFASLAYRPNASPFIRSCGSSRTKQDYCRSASETVG